MIFAVGFCPEALGPSEKLAFGIALDACSVYIPAVDAADITDIGIANLIVPARRAEGEVEVVVTGGDYHSVEIENDIALIFKMAASIDESSCIFAVKPRAYSVSGGPFAARYLPVFGKVGAFEIVVKKELIKLN